MRFDGTVKESEGTEERHFMVNEMESRSKLKM